MTPVAVERLSINGPAGALETIVEEPAPAAAPGSQDSHTRAPPLGGRYAVICHPHPLMGGTMNNKVVTTLAQAMHAMGIASLRFNFRGVGSSGGGFDAGAGETSDALSVAVWGARRWPGRDLVIAGFSFGAYVALRLAQRLTASHLIMIAPPVTMFDFSALEPPACPSLVVQGDADDVIAADRVIDWVESLPQRPRLVVMPSVGHFFHRHLPELRDAVIGAVRGG